MVLYSIPRSLSSMVLWGVTAFSELALAKVFYDIEVVAPLDNSLIGKHYLHNIDPSPFSYTCFYAVESSKFTSVVFVISVVSQVLFIATLLHHYQKRKELSYQFRVGVSDTKPESISDGNMEILLVCQYILGACVCGGGALRACTIFFRYRRIVRHCVHRKVREIFFFSMLCSIALGLFYISISIAAVRSILQSSNVNESESDPQKDNLDTRGSKSMATVTMGTSATKID